VKSITAHAALTRYLSIQHASADRRLPMRNPIDGDVIMTTLNTALGHHESPGAIVAAPLTERSKQFRAYAADCHQIAERYCDLMKEQYEALARQWLVVAEQAERKI